MLKAISTITNAIGALNYKGTWDANANSPALASSVGTKGDYYVVSTAGSTNLNGISNWGVGDLATFNGSVWQRVEGGADLNGVNLSVSGTSTLAGNLNFSSTAQRITGDFSNATFANRLAFQNSTVNGNTIVGAIPNGTSTTGAYWIFNNSDITNAGRFRFSITTTDAALISDFNGTGTYIPILFLTGGSERVRIDTSGIVTMSAYGVGTATFSAAGVISSVSDETWKIKDGVPVDADSMLMKLEPGYWYYNDEKKEIFGAERQLGFYAQNVNAAIGPEAAPIPETTIQTTNDGSEISTTKPWGYYDRSVLAVVVISLQKALVTIESLTERIKALESR